MSKPSTNASRYAGTRTYMTFCRRKIRVLRLCLREPETRNGGLPAVPEWREELAKWEEQLARAKERNRLRDETAARVEERKTRAARFYAACCKHAP